MQASAGWRFLPLEKDGSGAERARAALLVIGARARSDEAELRQRARAAETPHHPPEAVCARGAPTEKRHCDGGERMSSTS